MYYQKMIGWSCPLSFRPCLRYVVLICDTHMVCVWPSIVLFLPLFILLWSRKNDSEAARIPQWQQAMSEELPVLQKTSTLSDREGFKPLPDGNTTIEGNSDSLGIDSEKKPHWQRRLLYGLWLQLPRWKSSLRSSEMWGMLFWKEN